MSEGPELACVQTPLLGEWHTQREEWRINVLPWYRLVGVVLTGRKTGLPARVCGHHVVRG